MLLFFALACGSSEPCIESKTTTKIVSQAAKEKEVDGVMISTKESELLNDYLDDLREGIRAWNSESIGICKGKSRDCEEFLGTEVQLTEEGVYSVRAEFQAPKIQPEEGWKITFSINCEITKTSGTSETKTTKSYTKEYDGISHRPEGGNGYRLSPLYTMTSPSNRGDETCSWKIEGNNLEKPAVWEGSYVIPAKAK